MNIQLDMSGEGENNQKNKKTGEKIFIEGDLFKNFYSLIKDVVSDLNGTTSRFKSMRYNSKDIFILNHGKDGRKNVWNTMRTYISPYFYLDKYGYAGWSEMGKNDTLFKESQKLDIENCKSIFEKIQNEIINSRSTKYIQKDKELKINDPYIFIPLQVPKDSVIKTFAWMTPVELAKECIKFFKDKGIKVVIKQHPLDHTSMNWAKGDHVIITDASIHDIIPNALGVYTVNSGVGFESLIYLKHVFVAGHNDYKWVCNEIHNKKDIEKTFYKLQEKVDEDKIIKYITYCISEYYVKCSYDSIMKKFKKDIIVN